MTKRKNRWIWKVAVFALVPLFHLGASGAQAAPPEGVFKEAIHWPISADWLDPATGNPGTLGWFPLQLLHDSLVKSMPEGTYAPCLAESYTISPDSKLYEFKLRKGAKFQNGDPVTAEDVEFSFWRYKGRLAKMFHEITEKVEVVNPELVRFHFKKPFPDFLDHFLPGGTSIGWIVPKKYVEKVGEAGYKQNPIGAGPYKLVEFVPGVKLVAEAFEGYWRKVPNVKRIEIYIVPDRATRLAMVKRGEVDVATQLTDVLYEEVKKDPNLRLLVPVSPSRFFIYMAAQWDPKSPWSDLRVRQAASLAIDRAALADIHMPGGKPVGTIGLADDPTVVDFPPDPYDPEKAKKLLAEAGYPNGFDGGKYYPNELYWTYSEQVANYWRAIGIRVEMVRLERAAWMAFRNGGKMKGAVFMDPSTAPTMAGRLAYLFGPTAYGSYPDIEALWKQYENEFRPEPRAELLKSVQRLVYDKVLWLPLTEVNSPAAVGQRVKGNPYGIQPLLWYPVPFEDIEMAK